MSTFFKQWLTNLIGVAIIFMICYGMSALEHLTFGLKITEASLLMNFGILVFLWIVVYGIWGAKNS